ncbi:carbohydrate ABC transporter permease [Angustibacter aerolatus]
MTAAATEGVPPTAAEVATSRDRRRPPRAGRGTQQRQQTRAALLFISPWMIGFLVFTAGPMVASLVLSFTGYDLVSSPHWVGLDNYRELAGDPKVLTAVRNTAFYTVLHVPLSMLVAMLLALSLQRLSRAQGFFRTVVYLPVMTPPVAIGAMFLLLLNGRTGLVNEVLSWFGVQGPAWTTDPSWIKPGLVLMSLWTVGGTAVIYLAALKDVPEPLLEAALLDGAGPWRRFRSVTLPMISGTVYFTLIVNTIASLQTFSEVYTMYFGNAATSSGSGDAALMYAVYLFQQAFQFLHMGYASAMAWLLFLVVMVVTLVQVQVARRRVYYEGG